MVVRRGFEAGALAAQCAGSRHSDHLGYSLSAPVKTWFVMDDPHFPKRHPHYSSPMGTVSRTFPLFGHSFKQMSALSLPHRPGADRRRLSMWQRQTVVRELGLRASVHPPTVPIACRCPFQRSLPGLGLPVITSCSHLQSQHAHLNLHL